MDDAITSIYGLLDAIEAVIKAADPAKREALTRTIDAYAEDFPEDFFWATGSLLNVILPLILNVCSCRVRQRMSMRFASCCESALKRALGVALVSLLAFVCGQRATLPIG